MFQNLKSYMLTAVFTGLILSGQAQERRCMTMEVHRHKLQNDSTYSRSFRDADSSFHRMMTSGQATTGSQKLDSTLTIPVVVHVLYFSPEQNISDEQIQSQIDVLNEDFALLNATSLDIPADWIGFAKDSKFRFRLAQRDPSGNFTTGITRTKTYKSEFAILDPKIDLPDSGGAAAWPNSSYLNIWVCNLEFNALGFAYIPGPGMSPEDDGLVISYEAFGRNGTVIPPYNLGRTTTHEVGHWLGLRHIWGDEDGCTGSDDVNDTPDQEKATFRCPRYPKTDNCTVAPPGIMYMNYMDYTDDKCMMFFTSGQIDKMRTALDAYRDSLYFSNGHILPAPLPADLAIDSVLSPVLTAVERCIIPEILIRNNGIDTVDAFTLSYGISGNIKKVFRWAGSLPPGDTLQLKLPRIGTGVGDQVMEFRIAENDSNRVNNYRSSGFYMDALSVSGCSTVGVVAYPNPVTGQRGLCIKVNRTESQESSVSVFNSLGQMVYKTVVTINPGDAVPLDFTGLGKGVYFVNISGEQYSESIKVICLPGENAGPAPSSCN